MRSFKQINIKNSLYYFFIEMHNIKNFDSDSIKRDKKSYKNIDIYYISYITAKFFDHDDFHAVIPFYFIIGKPNGYIEKIMEINT